MAVVIFLVATVAINGLFLLAAGVWAPALRDPEYGRRARALEARLAEHPARPLVLVVGSSRVGCGVRPSEWELTRPNEPGRPDPLLFNMGRAGAGPVVQLLTLRRVYADGVRPAVVLIEYWPPFLNAAEQTDMARLRPEQTFPSDWTLLRQYFPDHADWFREARQAWVNPLYGARQTLLLQLVPEWLPWSQRIEGVWAGLNEWGWLAGVDLPADATERRWHWLREREPLVRPKLRNFAVAPAADHALREAVALARAYGAVPGLVFLPESEVFRSWYPASAERAISRHLDRLCAELHVPLLDAREWMAEEAFVDGFHLSHAGAAAFTRRLGAILAAGWPASSPGDRR